MNKVLFLNVFTGLALFACMENNTAPEKDGPKGTARIKLPVVPETALALAKSGTSMPALPRYSFSVTVSGPGMSTRTQTWDAAAFGGKTVTLEDLPSGSDRVFTGRIMRGMNKTHEGSYTVDIRGGESVLVPLVLRDVGSGRAEICIEVEGWPTPDCTPIDTTWPTDPFIPLGCWQVKAWDGGTALSGTLSIIGMEGSYYGRFEAANGFTYFANPEYVNGAWRITIRPAIPVDPGFGGGTLIEDGKDMPVYRTTGQNVILPVDTLIMPPDTLIVPPDSSWSRSFQLRIDAFAPKIGDVRSSYISGVMMDPSYTVKTGEFAGSAVPCNEVVIDDPVDTNWVVDTSWVHGDSWKCILLRPTPAILPLVK